MALLLAGFGCRPTPAAAPYVPAPAPAAATPVPLEPPAEAPTAAPETEPQRKLLQTELGWVRAADDPAAATLQLRRANGFGPGGDALVESIVGTADALLTCWEQRDSSVDGRVTLRVDLRSPADPGDDPLSVSSGNQTADPVVQCADEALRAVVPRPTEGAGAVVLFTMVPRHDQARVRRASPDELVAVRVGGTCWQWEDYPCAPNKHCKADEWVPTTCGEPTQRDDVQLHFGLGTPTDGYASPVDIRLLGGDATVLWRQPLSETLASKYGRAFPAAASAELGRVAYGVDMGLKTLTIGDAHGVRAYDRSNGNSLMSWSADVGEPRMWFDDGEFVLVRGNKEVCRGNAGHGGFFATCGETRVYFNGHTAALLEGDPLRVAFETALGQREAKLESSVMPTAKIRLGKYRLEVKGIIYLD